MKKAVILFSGGLDSTTCLAMAKADGFACFALSFSYGQRHEAELKAAKNIAKKMRVVEHRVLSLDMGQFGGSSLTDGSLTVPDFEASAEVPNTYVPARNTVFLSLALGYAEVVGAQAIYIGANSVDYSNYPDCREDYLHAFQTLANLATRSGREGKAISTHAPLLHLSKADIIQAGMALGIDYGKTVSCYRLDAEGRACGSCDSCTFRAKGFSEAGFNDPTHYQ